MAPSVLIDMSASENSRAWGHPGRLETKSTGDVQRSHLYAEIITSAEAQLIPANSNDARPAVSHHLDQRPLPQAHFFQSLDVLRTADQLLNSGSSSWGQAIERNG